MIDPSFYSLHLSPTVWIFTGISTICALLLIWLWAGRARRIWRKAAADNDAALPESGYPSASVVVSAHGNGRNLATLLPAILEQDYPAPMEVIVVNNENSDSTADVVGSLQINHPNLYMTYVPDHARNLSRRKLCITLGIKAARYEYVVLTEGACRINSPLWLRSMMRHAINGADVVLGYAVDTDEADGNKQQSRWARLRSFDRVWSAVRWLGAAINRHPYRGSSANLAYRRQLFFDHKGFSKSLNLVYGDDDLFINEIVTPHNCAVELSDASRVENPRAMPRYMHKMERQQRAFTAGMLPKAPALVMGLCACMWWLWLASAIAAGITGWPSVIPIAIVTAAGTALLLYSCRQWHKACRSLGIRPLLLTIPLFAIWHPIYGIKYRISARRHKKANYTNMA